ncbi:response regulator [Pannonibacter phragmitetus]|uniref:response regulator n=1 Tax=Pannonibacter phragmitetus TaxID=121719 RepID=UPI003D2EF59C
MRQILFNLAGNGIKFTEEGGVLISLAIAPQGSGSLLTLEVRDTGIGFSASDAERLFGEFEQVDHGPARRFGGTGLGLAIVRRLAGLMDGTVEALAEEGKGALFRICLPLPEAPDAAPRAGEGLASLENRRVVIVSQGVIEGEALALQFTGHGARVQIVQPGDDTLADALPHADLVLLEHGAVADGAGWLATARAAGCAAPAIVLVTPQERDRLDRLREAGFSAYLVRPVRGRTLRRIIASLMGEGGETLAWEAAVDLPPERIPGAPHRLAPARPLRLLLAEDNDINRLLGEALLRKLGHEVTVVPDGLEAWRAASEQTFDAILMDLHMPGLDGLDAMAQIREIETARGRPHVPVMIVTADVMPAARDRARASGVAGFLTKPLSREAVEEALENLPSRT